MRTFAVTMKEVFQKPGQTTMDFFTELKALSTEERSWYHKELNNSGFECSEPGVAS